MRLSSKQIGIVVRCLRMHVVDHPEGPPYVQYTNGWTDGKVARETGVSIFHVRRIRSESFGELHKALPVKGSVAARLDDLQRRVEALELAFSDELNGLLEHPVKVKEHEHA